MFLRITSYRNCSRSFLCVQSNLRTVHRIIKQRRNEDFEMTFATKDCVKNISRVLTSELMRNLSRLSNHMNVCEENLWFDNCLIL
jgi:hypothetical protein